MMSEPKTVPIPEIIVNIHIRSMIFLSHYQKVKKYVPAPEPATPTVAAPAPMNLAAVSISRLATETDIGLK